MGALFTHVEMSESIEVGKQTVSGWREEEERAKTEERGGGQREGFFFVTRLFLSKSAAAQASQEVKGHRTAVDRRKKVC